MLADKESKSDFFLLFKMTGNETRLFMRIVFTVFQHYLLCFQRKIRRKSPVKRKSAKFSLSGRLEHVCILYCFSRSLRSSRHNQNGCLIVPRFPANLVFLLRTSFSFIFRLRKRGTAKKSSRRTKSTQSGISNILDQHAKASV